MDSISQEIVCQAYARTGLLGNPSDQFEGKSIALCISNYYAEVGKDLEGFTGLLSKMHCCQQGCV